MGLIFGKTCQNVMASNCLDDTKWACAIIHNIAQTDSSRQFVPSPSTQIATCLQQAGQSSPDRLTRRCFARDSNSCLGTNFRICEKIYYNVRRPGAFYIKLIISISGESGLFKWDSNGLSQYKFKNWNVTESRKKSVTGEMKKVRAKKIADILNDPQRWHSHARSIQMETLTNEIGLKIEDYGRIKNLEELLQSYTGLLKDYMSRENFLSVVHAEGYF